MMDFTGKACVITGSARGIGRAVAEKLSSLGAAVVISDVNADMAAQTAKEISSLGRKCLAVGADVTQAEQAEHLIESCVSAFGQIDVLVNNAGITKDTLLVTMKKEQWDQVIAVNLTGTFLCSHFAFKHMLKKKSGCIINVSSIAGEFGSRGQTNYSASKAGIIGFTKSLAMEGASRGIRCNAVAPGFIKTDMTAGMPEKVREEMAKRIPLGRMGLPEDVANGIAFLCSDMAAFITGHILDINGGGFQ